MPDTGPPKVPLGRVTFPDAAQGLPLEVELMLTEAHQDRGMMWRKEMAESHGMMFVFPEPAVHTFWMRNTCLSLDLIYVAADGFIVGIVENARTLDDDPLGINCKAKYVIEVNAGYSRRHGVRAGQTVQITGVPELARPR